MGSPLNIFEKLAAITAELNAVAKNLKVGEGRNSYKAVCEGDVLAAVKPLEAKYNVYSYPYSREIVDSDKITTKKIYNGQENETIKFYMRVKTVYRFVNTEDPAEFCEVTTYGDGIDPGDKAPGKAMTYGDKYALLKAYKIITGDDPDQTSSEEPKAAMQHVVPDEVYFCDACNKPIDAVKKRDGSIWNPAEVVEYSRRRFEKTLCADCIKQEDKKK